VQGRMHGIGQRPGERPGLDGAAHEVRAAGEPGMTEGARAQQELGVVPPGKAWQGRHLPSQSKQGDERDPPGLALTVTLDLDFDGRCRPAACRHAPAPSTPGRLCARAAGPLEAGVAPPLTPAADDDDDDNDNDAAGLAHVWALSTLSGMAWQRCAATRPCSAPSSPTSPAVITLAPQGINRHSIRNAIGIGIGIVLGIVMVTALVR